MPFTTTWMNPECIMRQSEKDTIRLRSYVEFKKQNKCIKGEKRDKLKNRLLTTATELMVTGGEVGVGMGEIREGD